MVEERSEAAGAPGEAQERAAKTLAELMSVASAERVYSEPVVAGDRTVITAAEIRTGMGFGYGLATGPMARALSSTGSDAKTRGASSSRHESQDGVGGPRSGGGGGGQAFGRPVAVITMGPDGVTVQPVLDRTKIALTAMMAGAFGLVLLGIRRTRRS